MNLNTINVEDIRKYFNTSRKEFLDKPLSEFGFKLYKSSTLARISRDNVFQFIDIHKHRDGGQFTIDVAIRPLYCPNEDHLTLLPGNRLYSIATKGENDKWWPTTTEVEIVDSLKEVLKFIREFALPFFNATTTSKDIIKSYEKNFFGKSRFGKSIVWGTLGWEHFDFGHIYLREGDNGNAIKHFNKCYKEFKNDDRDWAQEAAKKCLGIIEIIKGGQVEASNYLDQTITNSKTNLKLDKW